MQNELTKLKAGTRVVTNKGRTKGKTGIVRELCAGNRVTVDNDDGTSQHFARVSKFTKL